MKPTKLLRIILLLIVAGMMGTYTKAQSVKYTYDAAGNRVSRTKVINMTSMVKSSTGETGTENEVATTEVPKYEDMLSEMKITIYPNPTKGMLRVDISGGEIPKGAKVYLYNISGILVRQFNGISGSNEIDISSQPSGTYIMRIYLDNEHNTTWKIIKE